MPRDDAPARRSDRRYGRERLAMCREHDMQPPERNPIAAENHLQPHESKGLGDAVRTLKRWVLVLCAGGIMFLPLPLQATEGYTLVLKDGRRIDITAYEEAGAWVYYYRYDARIGIPRDKIKTIIAHASGAKASSLDDEILGRVAREHKRRFRLDDFRREKYIEHEIASLLSPQEQQAYIRKLLQLKKMEIFEIDDQRQIAERQGDVVELAQLEEKLVRAIAEWVRGREALARFTHGQTAAGRAVDDHPALPEDEGETVSDASADGSGVLAESADTLAGLEKLHYRRETLRLVLKKYYQVDERTGGFHARRQAAEELRIVELQIRYFDRLPAAPFPESDPAPPLTDAPALTTE